MRQLLLLYYGLKYIWEARSDGLMVWNIKDETINIMKATRSRMWKWSRIGNSEGHVPSHWNGKKPRSLGNEMQPIILVREGILPMNEWNKIFWSVSRNRGNRRRKYGHCSHALCTCRGARESRKIEWSPRSSHQRGFPRFDFSSMDECAAQFEASGIQVDRRIMLIILVYSLSDLARILPVF